MSYEPIDQASIDRCMYGLVDDVSKLFTGVRYVKSKRDSKRGSWLEKDSDELFISCKGAGPESWAGTGLSHATVCRPAGKQPSFPAASWRCPNERGPGSINVIAWPRHGKCLVIATDPNFIGDRWLGFVPTEQINALLDGLEIPA